jgi:glyoxylase-like metal-dependent hydrolase (beta-lactamase superfamily II)
MHQDHVGAVAQLPRATFVVDAREWQGASDSGFLHGYRRALYDHDYDWRALDFGAEQVSSFASFGHAIDLFADGSVRLLSTPGHTKGHMSVLLRLKSGRELLLTGDAAYARKTIDDNLLPLLTWDDDAYKTSLNWIREWVAAHPGAPVIPGHDSEAWATLEAVYS